MEGFDTSTMTYMASNFDGAEVVAPEAYSNMMMMPNDFMDQYSTYDAQTFAGYVLTRNSSCRLRKLY